MSRAIALFCVFVAVTGGVGFPQQTSMERMQAEFAKRWLDLDRHYLVSYADYKALYPPQQTQVVSIVPFITPLEGKSRGRVAILVNTNLFDQVQDSVYTWISDLGADGWDVVLIEAVFGTVEELKDELVSLWSSDAGLEGCILVGDFPVPWFRLESDFGSGVSEFPVDLYYEDLDGEFVDEDGDGMFDEHTDGQGDVEPEIWLGRLTASPLSGDEALLVNRYLQRDHSYRAGEILVPHRALLFIDRDWIDCADYWQEAVSKLYDETRLITDDEETNAQEYRRRLAQGWEWVDVMVHSGPDASYFYFRDAYSIVKNTQIAQWRTNALFYVPFACSNSRYVEPDYFGGWYIFGENALGLCVIGSTKAGSLYWGDDMYQKIGEGRSIGEAFRFWFAGVAPYSSDDKAWFYGLTLLGDPTLHPPDTAPPEPPFNVRQMVNFFGSQPGITVCWEPSLAEDLAGYRFYYDTDGSYPPFDGLGLPQGDSPIDMGLATSFTIGFDEMSLLGVHKFVVAVTAYDVRGNESRYSQDLTLTARSSLNPPKITWVRTDRASQISYAQGGQFKLYVWAEDDEDPVGSLSVELLLDSEPTGISLFDDGTHGDSYARDGCYTIAIQVPAEAIAPGKYLISVVATDSDGNQSEEYPYLVVPQQGSARRFLGHLSPAEEPAELAPFPLGDDRGPVIVGGFVGWSEYIGMRYAQVTLEVYHPISYRNIEQVELYLNGEPTGVLLDEYDYSGNWGYFWVWRYLDQIGLPPGRYLIGAVATDIDGNQSEEFPYLWVN